MDLDEISLFKNKVNRNNFIAVCFLWSSSGFINYLLVYYSKYFQGNFFFNYSFQGGSEGLGLIWIGILTRWFNVVSMIRVVGILIVWFALIQLALMNYLPSQEQAWVLPIILMMLRLQVTSVRNYGYHINQYLFPVLVRGQVYGYVNFISRPFAALATVLTEYTSEPILFVLFFGSLIVGSLQLITEPKHKSQK